MFYGAFHLACKLRKKRYNQGRMRTFSISGTKDVCMLKSALLSRRCGRLGSILTSQRGVPQRAMEMERLSLHGKAEGRLRQKAFVHMEYE